MSARLTVVRTVDERRGDATTGGALASGNEEYKVPGKELRVLQVQIPEPTSNGIRVEIRQVSILAVFSEMVLGRR